MCVQITSSGAHRCVCVQLRLYNLAVAAIERCEALAEIEGAGSVGMDPAAGPAFKVLKQLVHSWLTDAVQNGNRCRDRHLLLHAPHPGPQIAYRLCFVSLQRSCYCPQSTPPRRLHVRCWPWPHTPCMHTGSTHTWPRCVPPTFLSHPQSQSWLGRRSA